ncbi:MAG: hypothetical protein IJS56_04390 [Bacilli bacterium]|nr:hypothetical protein [Bacilli bacterium]
MNSNVTRLEIRHRILSQTKPFCLVDLNNRINKNNDADKGLIIDELDQLYDAGLIEYDKVVSEDKGFSGYAFQVVNESNNIKKLTKTRNK